MSNLGKMQLALNFIKVVTNSLKCSYAAKLGAKYSYFFLHYHKEVALNLVS